MFDPCQISKETSHTPGLELAYALVYHAMDFGSALDYWRGNTEDQRINISSLKRDWSSTSQDDLDSDLAIKEAKRQSCVDLGRNNKTTLFTPSTSLPKRRRSPPRRLPPGLPADIRRHFPPTTKPPPTGSSSQDLPIRSRVQPADIVEGDMYVKISESYQRVLANLVTFSDQKATSSSYFPSVPKESRSRFHGRKSGGVIISPICIMAT